MIDFYRIENYINLAFQWNYLPMLGTYALLIRLIRLLVRSVYPMVNLNSLENIVITHCTTWIESTRFNSDTEKIGINIGVHK